uniref:FKBP-type peptidyl-prolyl cis-trans isomerase n=1 Tax=Janibacter limosus TaxID=53458 RepID=A0AC61U7X5_9MICO|nr:FKBP-type peptidyl-prolyl cis-trans isomerase [Janibacter limosus]
MPKVKFHDDAPADISTEGVAKPKKLVTEKLIAGKGKEIKTGDQVYASYTGVRLKDGTMFDTSFKKGGQPFPFVVGQPGTIEARQKAVKGAHVGDRLLLVAPAKDGYGKKGSPDGSIKPNTDPGLRHRHPRRQLTTSTVPEELAQQASRRAIPTTGETHAF